MATAAREGTSEQMGILAFPILPGNWFPTLSAFPVALFANNLFVCGFA